MSFLYLIAGFDMCLLLSAVAQVGRIQLATRFLAAAARPPVSNPRRPLVVLIPMWREQGTVGETIRVFAEATSTRPWLHVYLITSDDDATPPATPDSTADVARAALAQAGLAVGGITVIGSPATDRTKAAKIRGAASREEIRVGHPNIAIFDADSRPETAVFDHVARRLDESPGSEVVLQQTSLHVCSHGPGTSHGWLLAGHTLRQNRWALHFELGRLLRRRRLPLVARRFTYVIGHGVFLSWSAFERALPSHEWGLDDAWMSVQLRTPSVRLEAVPTFDRCEVPPTVSGVVRQKASWFSGPVQAWRRYSAVRLARSSTDRALRDRIEALKFGSHAVYWAFGPLIYLAALPMIAIAEGGAVLLAIHMSCVIGHAWGVDAVAARRLRRLGVTSGGTGIAKGAASVAAWALWGWCALVGFRPALASVNAPRTERSWEAEEHSDKRGDRARVRRALRRTRNGRDYLDRTQGCGRSHPRDRSRLRVIASFAHRHGGVGG
jgi:hypothetical protein